jgi:putative ATP-binding cassette transporter
MLTIENLQVESPTGRDRLQENALTIQAGERVLVRCDPGTNKTALFRALAGLWPWGSGRIVTPRDDVVLYVPRGTPYLPRGTLREVLAYPQAVDRFDHEAYCHALKRASLSRLRHMLDEIRRWDRELSQDDQLSLTFARIVLQAPAWVIIDDAFGSLEEAAIRRVIEVMRKELRHTAVIHIGKVAFHGDEAFTRTVHLSQAVAAGGAAPKPEPRMTPEHAA